MPMLLHLPYRPCLADLLLVLSLSFCIDSPPPSKQPSTVKLCLMISRFVSFHHIIIIFFSIFNFFFHSQVQQITITVRYLSLAASLECFCETLTEFFNFCNEIWFAGQLSMGFATLQRLSSESMQSVLYCILASLLLTLSCKILQTTTNMLMTKSLTAGMRMRMTVQIQTIEHRDKPDNMYVCRTLNRYYIFFRLSNVYLLLVNICPTISFIIKVLVQLVHWKK